MQVRKVAGPRSKLTRRERDVLGALCAPLGSGDSFVEPASIRDIAETLGVSDAAIKQHLLKLYDKFGIESGEERRRTRLANAAVASGAIKPAEERVTVPGAGEGASLDALGRAREAAGLRNWRRAFEELSSVPQERIEESAEDQELLGEAAIWSGHHEVSVSARQKAYSLFVRANSAPRAALVALSLCVNHAVRLDFAQASGWLAKARRHLEANPEGVPWAALRVTEAFFQMFSGQFEAALDAAREGQKIVEQAKHADLLALSLVTQGYALWQLGHAEQAKPLLDEAMVSATSGELGPFATGIVYCRTVCASLDALDYEHALEWTEAIEHAGADACMAGFPGDCRAHRATLLVMRGDWKSGEREASTASEEAQRHDLMHAGIAENEIGLVRLRSGDLERAKAAFVRAHELGYPPMPGLALLELASGEPSGALSSIQSALEHTPENTPLRAKLLPALVEIAIAAQNLSSAETAADDLDRIGARHPSLVLRASSLSSRGALLLAKGETASARDALRRAVPLWLQANVPFEAARTRVRLAEALVKTGDSSGANLEVGAASSVLEKLGARPELERAKSVLASLRGS